MRKPAGPVAALGFSPAASAMLQRLQQAGLVTRVHGPEDPEPSATWLAGQWPSLSALVAVGACGLVVRLIAPLLSGKASDPAVIVLDADGRFVIPLLGGHQAGGEQLAQEIAALLEATPVLTGSTAARGDLALDSFGTAWGWQRGDGDWQDLMVAAAAGQPLHRRQDCGSGAWTGLAAAAALRWSDGQAHAPENGAAPAAAELVVSHRRGAGCRWHPPCLWLGLGCERDTDLSLLERLIDSSFEGHGLAPQALAGVASIDRKGDEPALLELVRRRGWPLRLFSAEQLAAVTVPNPSETVAGAMGTASVAEAAALLAAREAGEPAARKADAPAQETAGGAAAAGPRLLVAKTIERAREGERGAATLAVALAERAWAPAQGELHLVGSGPGAIELLSGDARRALARATIWVGYGPYLDLLEPLRRSDQLRCDGRLTEERQRCAEALDWARQGLRVALVSSGDSGIYGMAGLALDLWLQQPPEARPSFAVHPGISALQLAAARAGAPLMHDFCTISLSDRLTPWAVIERRLIAAAAGDFVVALYNPRSRDRSWQLERAQQLLLEQRPAGTPVLLARQLGRAEETLSLHSLAELPLERVDMLTLVLVGNSSTRVEQGRMLTPRGYPGAALN